MVKLTAFQAVAMGSSPIIRKTLLQFKKKGSIFFMCTLSLVEEQQISNLQAIGSNPIGYEFLLINSEGV